MRVTLAQTAQLARQFNIDTNVVSLRYLRVGLNVELEHGYRYARYGANVTNNRLETTMRIVLAHIIEFPDYYKRLQRMEERAEAYWSTRQKPRVFRY